VGFDELDCESHGSQPQAIHRINDDPAAAEAVLISWNDQPAAAAL